MPDTIPNGRTAAFIAAADTRPHPYPILIAVMFHAGLRVGELLTLAWCDLIQENQPLGALRIEAANTKSNRQRIVPINRALAARLRDTWNAVARPAGFTPGHYLAAAKPNGRPVTVRTIERHVQTAARKAGIPAVTPHTLRHTFATRLLAVSNLELVRKALGHSRVSTTQIYVHPTTEELASAVALAGDTFLKESHEAARNPLP